MGGRFGGLGLVIVMFAPTLPAAVALPTTGPAAAGPWLARAEREILACPAETPKDLASCPPPSLAIMLYRLSPSDVRRAMAIRLIDRALDAVVASAISADQVWGNEISGALCHAQVDDPAGARRLLAAAERPTRLPPTTEPMIQFGRSFIDGLKAETLLRLGDKAAFEQVALTPLAADVTIDDLRADGLDAEARFAGAWASKQAAAAATQPAITPTTAAATDLSSSAESTSADAVRKDLARGDLAAAEHAAADIKRPSTPQPDGPDMRDYDQAEAYALVAQACLRSGDLNRFHSALDGFLAAARRDPTYLSQQSQELLELCARIKDQASFALLADMWRDSLALKATGTPEDRIDFVEQTSELARQCAAVGDVPRYRSAVERAETVMASMPPSDSRPDANESPAHKRAIVWLRIAAARARAGDAAGVAHDEAESLKAGTVDPDDRDSPWYDLAKTCADASRFDDAVAAARKVESDRYGFLPSYIARRMARAGRFDQAWRTLRGTPATERIKAEYDLVVQHVVAGQKDGLDARINVLPSPNERALGDLAAAAALLGHPYMGPLRVFKPRDE